MLDASSGEPVKVQKDEHTPKILSRLSRPSGKAAEPFSERC